MRLDGDGNGNPNHVVETWEVEGMGGTNGVCISSVEAADICISHKVSLSFPACLTESPTVLSGSGLFLSFHSPLLCSAFILLSLNSSGIHTEKSILLGLFAFGREHRHI